MPRDLSGYNALTFWAKASINATLNVAGLGNDNTGTSRFTAEQSGIAVTPAWTKYIIPIPDAPELDQERGMFYFAEGPGERRGLRPLARRIEVRERHHDRRAAARDPRSIAAEVRGAACT